MFNGPRRACLVGGILRASAVNLVQEPPLSLSSGRLNVTALGDSKTGTWNFWSPLDCVHASQIVDDINKFSTANPAKRSQFMVQTKRIAVSGTRLECSPHSPRGFANPPLLAEGFVLSPSVSVFRRANGGIKTLTSRPLLNAPGEISGPFPFNVRFLFFLETYTVLFTAPS